MSDLPDIDTSEVGPIAYWNAHEHGASSIDPEEALDHGRIVEYTLYDNGWEGTFELHSHDREATVRVKTDGWIVAFLDRTNDYDLEMDEDEIHLIRGYWDLHRNWYQTESSAIEFTENALENAIDRLQAQLSDDHTYHWSDVGLYVYEYEDASTITGMHAHMETASFIITEGTDIDYASMAGGMGGSNASEDIYWVEDDIRLSDGEHTYGTLDLLDPNRIDQTEYEYEVDGGAGDHDGHADRAVLVFLWS